MRRATSVVGFGRHNNTDFYPRSPCGERRVLECTYNGHADFYPRSPCGERRGAESIAAEVGGFLSTLSLRRATRFQAADISARRISIHALLAESDCRRGIRRYLGAGFLSTLSLRRATIVMVGLLMFSLYFYPRSPCGERPWDLMGGLSCDAYFYPRSPCGERPMILTQRFCALIFLSTLSLRRATREPTALRTPHHKFLSTLSLRRATQQQQLCCYKR